LHYLSRYTHRVCISNARMDKATDLHVLFTYRDPKHPTGKKIIAHTGAEFLRQFFLHVLPIDRTRIWHYGFLGKAVRKKNIPLLRGSIDQTASEAVDDTPIERVYATEFNVCPCCRGKMEPVRELVIVGYKGAPSRRIRIRAIQRLRTRCS